VQLLAHARSRQYFRDDRTTRYSLLFRNPNLTVEAVGAEQVCRMFDDHKALKPGNTIARINHLTAASATDPRSCRDRIVEAFIIAAKKNAGTL
jgi:predicted methyltransferase